VKVSAINNGTEGFGILGRQNAGVVHSVRTGVFGLLKESRVETIRRPPLAQYDHHSRYRRFDYYQARFTAEPAPKNIELLRSYRVIDIIRLIVETTQC